ncbi:MAG: sigma 54-interacting transcriptional regulator, partial [Acidobacteria bacterium]|nr:sigma 54-interacting transcriptional regulator [Acidobacteriota bacterium]
MPVVCFRPDEKANPRECSLAEIAASESPAVFIAESSRARSALGQDPRFVVRRRDPRKPLKAYLLGGARPSDRIPVLGSEYTTIGRLESAVESLLQRARSAGQHLVCVLMVPGATFAGLQARRLEPGPERGEASTSEFINLFGYDPEAETLLATHLWGESLRMKEVRQKILLAARAPGVGKKPPQPVLIAGPTGSGKTKGARLIHEYSNRRTQ